MEKLCYKFCLGCIYAFALVLVSNLVVSLTTIDQIDQFVGCFTTITVEHATVYTPIMLFCGALYVVIFSHDGSEKKEGN